MTLEDRLDKLWATKLSWQEEGFLFASLMLLTCFFLPWRGDETPVEIVIASKSMVVAFLWLSPLPFLCLTPLTVRLPRVRPWAGLWTSGMVSGLALSGGTGSYGVQMARLFSLAMLILSAAPAVIAGADLAMKRLNAQKAEVWTHWGTALQGIQFSAQEFYTKVEAEIRARQWPGVELLRVSHTEAGLLSHKREYLRVLRQRQVFDICAATFGKDYFFTLREAEIQPQLSIATFLIFLAVLATLFVWCLGMFGFFTGLINFVLIVIGGFFLLFNALRMGLTRLDGLLMRLPVLGPVYETWFRGSTTYFQHDTRVIFLKLMDDLVKRQVDMETSAKGIELLSCFEHQPIFDGFYKVSPRNTKEPPPGTVKHATP